MKKQTPKYLVKKMYPDAVLVLDTHKGIYKSDWANQCVYAVGYFTTGSCPKGKVFETTWQKLNDSPNFEFLSGWRKTPKAAWKTAYLLANRLMLEKLQE